MVVVEDLWEDGIKHPEFICCDARADGGFMPRLFDTVPLPEFKALRSEGGTRMMRFGPPRPREIHPDVEPNGGAGRAKKLLYNRSDRPWNSLKLGREFSRPPYMPEGDPISSGPKTKLGRPRDGEEQPPRLAPIKAGKVSEPFTPYPHVADGTAKPDPFFLGKNLKCGKAPDYFNDSNARGPQMVSSLKPTGAEKAALLAKRPKPIGRTFTNTRKKDTFGDYPIHPADPYRDNPLGDEPKIYRRPFCMPCVPKSKPQIPIVNVWDHPACLQTKAGVRMGFNASTGERTTYLTDKGHLGTTI